MSNRMGLRPDTRWVRRWVVLMAMACVAGCGSSRPASEQPQPRLMDTAWRVEEISGQDVLDKARPTLKFDPDGRVSGSAGCNTFTGTSAVDGPKLFLSRLVSTQMTCPAEVTAQEQKFLSVMESVRSFSMDGDRLRLLDADGNPLIRLSRTKP